MSTSKQQEFREEKDLLGTMLIPAGALYGIHTQRAIDNFPLSGRPVNKALIRAYGAVKLACARTNFELGHWDDHTMQAIEQACRELMDGRLDTHFRVDALQGGAGTSTNMNVNEVLCNRALQHLGKKPGQYGRLHPIEDLNLHQSTNDTYPAALHVAVIGQLRLLEEELVALLDRFQAKEKEFTHVVKIGRTQLQDAVLTTMGRTMAAFAESVGRDRWRVYKCEERLRVVPLGGTAIGSGIGAPRRYIFKVVEHLKQITGFGLARAENMLEAIQNKDALSEVSSILETCAVNLIKIASDLRLMSSGPAAGFGELILPARQAGSSIMPGKVNPVIPEAVIQCGMTVLANHSRIAQACAQGNLELNAFMPLIADALLENLQLLGNAVATLNRNCITGLKVNEAQCRRQVENSTATLTALSGTLGYEKAQFLYKKMTEKQLNLRELVLKQGWITAEAFDQMVSAEQVMRLGNVPEDTENA